MEKSNILKNRKIKKMSLLLCDTLVILLANLLAIIILHYASNVSLNNAISIYVSQFKYIFITLVIYIMFLAAFNQYKSIWSLAGMDEFVNGVAAVIIGGIINAGIIKITPNNLPVIFSLLVSIFVMIFCNGIRIGWRILRRALMYTKLKNKGDYKKVLIYGAGNSGAIVLNEFKKFPNSNRRVVAFLDDNKHKKGTYVGGIKVYGNIEEAEIIVKEMEIDEIIIAISELKKDKLKSIINKFKELKVEVKIMPGLSEMIDGKFTLNSIRNVDVNDLLGREAIKLDHEGISDYLEEKVVLVTGGGGSIGSELCRQIVKFNPKQLIIFDIYENNAYDIQMELKRQYPKLNLVTLIGSVRDRHRLLDVYEEYKPNVVFHAAAHKHVPLMEDSPAEAIKNNVVGTYNVAKLACEAKVERFVLISTDKAVNPTNVMGATKRFCEMIIQSLNKISSTEFVAVRFGNVLGSNGSVVPLFKKQIEKGGPVTLTHKEITRYFMTIPEASQLVLQAGAYAKGGEIFVLDMGEPVKIYDLAENLIKLSGFEPHEDIKIKVTGLRPGEKLYEELLMSEEGLTETKHEKIFIGKPGEFDLDNIERSIEEILWVAINEDGSMLRNKLKEIVTTYKDPEEVNSKVG